MGLSSRGSFFLGEEHKQPAVRFFNFANAREEHIADFPGELPQLEKSGFGISPMGSTFGSSFRPDAFRHRSDGAQIRLKPETGRKLRN